MDKDALAVPFSMAHDRLLRALKASVKRCGGPSNGGLDNHMWAAVVDRNGIVLAVCYSGDALGDQWPGSRAIAIEKANTANALSLPGFAFSTANLYSGAQPGGYLYGIEHTNPVDTATMYAGDPSAYGTSADPMAGQKASGVVVFGGGLALYDGSTIVGGLGVSGDTSGADHNVAWRVRKALDLDRVPAGPTSDGNDAIVYDIGLLGKSSSGFGHPTCGNKEDEVAKEIGAAQKLQSIRTALAAARGGSRLSRPSGATASRYGPEDRPDRKCRPRTGPIHGDAGRPRAG